MFEGWFQAARRALAAGQDIQVFDWHPKGGRWIHIPAYAEKLEKVLRAKGVAPRRFKRLMPQPSLPGRARLTEHEDGQERASSQAVDTRGRRGIRS